MELNSWKQLNLFPAWLDGPHPAIYKELVFLTPIHASAAHGAASTGLLPFCVLALAQWCDNSHYNTCEEIKVLIKKPGA